MIPDAAGHFIIASVLGAPAAVLISQIMVPETRDRHTGGALPPEALSSRSRVILLYAMCGFANFGSLGIMIAELSTMAPARRDDVVSLGVKSIVSGTLSTCLLGAIVGILE